MIVVSALLASCDSRDDYFHEQGEAPVVELLKEDGQEFETTSDGKQYLKVPLSFGDTARLKLKVSDPYGKTLKASIMLDKSNMSPFALYNDPIYLEGNLEKYELSDKLTVKYDNTIQELLIIDNIKTAKDLEMLGKNLKEEEESNNTTNFNFKYNLIVKISNLIGVSTPFFVQLNLKGNQPPEPVFDLIPLGNNEYTIIVDAKDPNGDKVVLYEYAFDSSIFGKCGYEYSTQENVPSAGRGAYNGVYITTQLNSVKHAFQSSSSHTIAVRCKDEWNCWSSWYVKFVTTEDDGRFHEIDY